MEDKFDKVETVVKKTTKVAVLIIGSILTVALTIFLAWNQFDSKVNGVKETDTNNVTDTVKVEKVIYTPKKETVKEEPKKDVLDKSSDILDKADKFKDFIKK
jgi:hypothetical protein